MARFDRHDARAVRRPDRQRNPASQPLPDAQFFAPKPSKACACGGSCPRCKSKKETETAKNVATRAFSELWLQPHNVSRLMRTSQGSPMPGSGQGLKPTARLHSGKTGALVADAFGAEAVAVSGHVFAKNGVPDSVLRHESAHVQQTLNDGPLASRRRLEDEARRAAIDPSFTPELRAPADMPLNHPALRPLLRAGRWLTTRSTKTLSKHVARHGRRIAGRAVHSVFRNPRKIKSLVSQAVREGTALARRQATRAADEVLEEGGVRVMQQATRTPGKFRTIVEKDFGKSIGTRGEQVIRVVLDQSGRVVTAFPVDRFLAIGAGVIALEAFTASTAEAAELTRGTIEASENAPVQWGEVAFDLALDVVSFGLLASSPLNEGESLMLELDRIVRRAAEDTIREIETREGITLTDEQKFAIYELAQVAVGAPMEFEEIEAQAESGNASTTRYVRSPDGTVLDTQTGSVTLGPGLKL